VIHARRGDLVIELIAPNGSVRVLKSARSRDTAANVFATYRLNLSARNRNGLWRLRVRDTRRGVIGYLDAWSIVV
jgi:serine protease